MENPRCSKCGSIMRLQRHAEYGDLQAYCPSCKTTVYPLPKLSREDDRLADADLQQGDIELLITREGAPRRAEEKGS